MMVMDLSKKAELLTVQDVKEILEVILPKKEITERENLKIIEEKHKTRYSARMSHHRRNRQPGIASRQYKAQMRSRKHLLQRQLFVLISVNRDCSDSNTENLPSTVDYVCNMRSKQCRAMDEMSS